VDWTAASLMDSELFPDMSGAQYTQVARQVAQLGQELVWDRDRGHIRVRTVRHGSGNALNMFVLAQAEQSPRHSDDKGPRKRPPKGSGGRERKRSPAA